MLFGLADSNPSADVTVTPELNFGATFGQDPLTPPPKPPVAMEMVAIPTWLRVISMLSAGLSGYHGYKRNNSIGWGIGWFLLGGLFPVVIPTIAFAQGFGIRKK